MAIDPPAQAKRPTRDRLLPNDVLREEDQLVSPDGRYKLAIQLAQTLVLLDDENRVIWDSGTTGRLATSLRMQTNGNLALRGPMDELVWESQTGGANGGGTLIVKNQGTFAIVVRAKEIWTRPVASSAASPPAVPPAKPAPNPSTAPANTTTAGASQPASGSTTTKIPAAVSQPASGSTTTTIPAGVSQPASGSTTTTLPVFVSQPASGSTTTTVASGTSQPTPVSVAIPAANSPAVAARPVLCVRGGQSMIIKEPIYSPNGKVWACFQDDGNFVVRTASEVLYSADTRGKGIKTATLRTSGELIMSDNDQKQQWTSGSSGKEAGDTVLLVQDDGHAVILSGGTRVWRTTCRKQTGFDKDRLNADEYLDVEQRIVSQNGFYYMALSKSGYFCLGETLGAERTLWTNRSELIGFGGKRITMRGDDDLWVGEGESFSWSSTTRRRRDRTGNAALIVGDNAVGTVQVDGLVVWSSDPKKTPTSYHEAQQITPLATGRDRLRPGDYLPLNGTFWSKNGQFSGQMMESNNFNVFRKGTGGVWECLWSTKTGNTMVSKACLDWTGRFVLYGIGSKPVFETPTANSRGEPELVLQNDGNLVLSRDGSAVWSSQVAFPASIQTVDRIKWGEWLSIDQSLISRNGLYTLTFQDNANFCIKKKDTEPMYTNSAKSQTGSRLLHFNRDSNDLEIYDNKGKPLGGFSGKKLWSAAPGNKAGGGGTDVQDGAFIMGDDGNAVLILSGKVLWESKDNGAPLRTVIAPVGN